MMRSTNTVGDAPFVFGIHAGYTLSSLGIHMRYAITIKKRNGIHIPGAWDTVITIFGIHSISTTGPAYACGRVAQFSAVGRAFSRDPKGTLPAHHRRTAGQGEFAVEKLALH